MDSTLSFDDTNVVTGPAVAIVNPSSVATTVTITARDTCGQRDRNGYGGIRTQRQNRIRILRDLTGLAGIAGPARAPPSSACPPVT